MTCQSISIMARILLASAAVLTTLFLICGIAQGFITHTGHVKKTRPDITDYAFTYNGQLPTKVTNVVSLGKSMVSSAKFKTRAKEQNIGLDKNGVGESPKQASHLIGQQLQLTDMSKVNAKRGKPVNTARRYPTASGRKTSNARTAASPRTIPKQRKAPKSETEILFRKLAKEILTKLFEKFMLKAAAVKSPGGKVGSSNNITRPLGSKRVKPISRGRTGIIAQAGIPVQPRSLSRGLTRPRRPQMSQSPPVQSKVNPKAVAPKAVASRVVAPKAVSPKATTTSRPRDGFAMFNRMAQIQPFELFQMPAMPMSPLTVDPLSAFGPQNQATPNRTRTPFDFYRHYYQRQMDFDNLEDIGLFGRIEW